MNNNSDNQLIGANNVQTPKPSYSTNCPSSPAQGRSLREFEEQMASLRKENFNLKLRIYFLEEKPTTSMHHGLANSSSCPNIDSIESINKQNIDLKVSFYASFPNYAKHIYSLITPILGRE